jgi:two-component system phosphate regulon response regulator PhoB
MDVQLSSTRLDKPIFVVEDDEDIGALIKHHLQAAGYGVELFLSGKLVISQAIQKEPLLFVLDIMLPGMNGFDLCRQIRQTESLSKMPIIFLSARGTETDRIQGFELGCDDFMTKPFSPRELVARVRAVARAVPEVSQNEVLKVGDLEIDVTSMTVRVEGKSVLTTVREFRFLEYLATHRTRVFTRDQLLNAVWKESVSVTPRSVDVYVRRLREKIERDPANPRYLKTFRGIGYRFEDPR